MSTSSSHNNGRGESRDRGRREYILELPVESSNRGKSRDSSIRGSTYELVSTHSKERYLTINPGATLEIPREPSRDGRRRYSAIELSSPRPRRSSHSPLPRESSAAPPPSRKFQHSPLDLSIKRAIRIMRVRPHLSSGKIACDIDHATTTSHYTALSYTWGSAKSATETILLNNRPFMVRRNLHTFLEHARHFHPGKPLWIDAICINQEDIREKNRQVQMMAKIYSQCESVFVWLGPKVEYAGYTLKRMRDYEDMSDTEMAWSSSQDADFWKGFKVINSAAYWDRVWVIQEFIQSKHGRIIQGDHHVSFETFQNTIRRFDNRIYRLALQYWVFGPRRNEDFGNYISKIHPLWQRRIEGREGQKDAKWALLSGDRFCRDIRDRVYGIMPLATHGSTLKVDYNLNPFEVLLESIWLEHDTQMDRTEVLMNLANILQLTPASICMYASNRTSSARRYLKMLLDDADKVHLRAASSPEREEDWLLASSNGRKIEWRNFARDQRHHMPKGVLDFPRREQCPWQMFTYTASAKGNIGLKLAVDSHSVPDRKGRVSEPSYRKGEKMSEEEFLDRNSGKRTLALGIYNTTCAPYPLKIFYSMVDGLEDLGNDDRAFFALEALEDLDLDI